MALQKSITQEDGVVTNYHRILFMQTTVNCQNSIVVFSYIDEESREKEKKSFNPYKVSITYEVPYDENMSIKTAYEFLKTLPQFEGAIDI